MTRFESPDIATAHGLHADDRGYENSVKKII